MTDEQKLVETVTRGFASIHDELRLREGRVSALSEKIIGMEFELTQVSKTLAKMEGEIAKSETVKLEMRVAQLEKSDAERSKKQDENTNRMKGLLISVIILAIGFLLNFIRISVK
jgi:hypothetical protein